MLAGVSPPEQLSAPRTLYMAFRKAKLKKTWDSASLRTETLKVMVMQFLDQLLVFVCKSEDRDCKRGHGTVPI
jgi:hypothetical protein